VDDGRLLADLVGDRVVPDPAELDLILVRHVVSFEQRLQFCG
jgi:hypothetical protein